MIFNPEILDVFQCFYGVGKRVGQLEWVVEIIGTTRSLFREVREMGESAE